jgi:hypothetical protein
LAEICEGSVKRATSEEMDSSGPKKVKTEIAVLSNKQVNEKMEADAEQTKEVAACVDEKVDDEEDQTVVSLVEAAPRYCKDYNLIC